MSPAFTATIRDAPSDQVERQKPSLKKQNRLRSLPEQVDCTRRLRAMIEASASGWIGLNIRVTGAAEVAKGGRSARRGAKTACYGCPRAASEMNRPLRF